MTQNSKSQATEKLPGEAQNIETELENNIYVHVQERASHFKV